MCNQAKRILTVVGFLLTGSVLAEPGTAPELESRIDFGNAYVSGQTIKSGAVYLMHRKKNEIESMLKPRKNYRAEILEGFSEHESVAVRPEDATEIQSKE
jgi:hypothetical protein